MQSGGEGSTTEVEIGFGRVGRRANADAARSIVFC